MLVDGFGRTITYLRVSVTDRCNLRCVYCMPPQGVPRRAHHEIMRYEEIAEVVRAASAMGVTHVRLTGGEPLARLDLPILVGMIAAIPGIEDISLTTNAALLERSAPALQAAGLTRVNVSLDTLQPERFARLTRGGSLAAALRGLAAAEACGLLPIKLNVVALRGINEDELPALARLTLEHAWDVRFIELMPVNNQQSWGSGFADPSSLVLPVAEIYRALTPLGILPLPQAEANGPARMFRLEGGLGRIGLIAPLSEHFCQTCNRLRLTADGNLRPCLLHDVEIPMLAALRRGEDIQPYLRQAANAKPAGHELSAAHLPTLRGMSQIGG